MFKEIALISAVIAPNIVEPSRAITTNNEYEVINATNKKIILYQSYSDDNVEFEPKTFNTFPYKVNTEDGFQLYIYKTEYPSKPTNFYYIYNAADYEDPVSITFTLETSTVWVANISGYEPSRGIQIGQYESLNGVTAYIDENHLGINGTMDSSLRFDTLTNLIPNGVTFKYALSNQTFSGTVSELYAYKAKASIGAVNKVVLYAVQNQSVIVAFNGYEPNLNPFLLYESTFTNKIVFQSGYKTIKYGEMEGRVPWFFTEEHRGYFSNDPQSTSDAWDALTKAFELVGMIFTAIGTPLAWVVMPGISIGLLLAVPLLIAMFVWLIRFLKKGG